MLKTVFSIAASLLILLSTSFADDINLSPEAALEVGKKIWKNECAGTIEGLTSWNQGETFASLGICHFIWYPKGQEGPFEESFPLLIKYLDEKGVDVPDWADDNADCPWNTRDAFMKDQQSPKMVELRNFLQETVAHQALFAAVRLENSLTRILTTQPLDPDVYTSIEKRFYDVAATPSGVYALVDYVNFKGEGTKTTERYNGEGWGLLQVLENMKDAEAGNDAVAAFAESGRQMLARRVKNSPPERNENRWLEGWNNRINTYVR